MQELFGELFLLILALPLLANAQTALSLRDAVEQAQKKYPAVEVSKAQVEAAAAGIRVARTSFLPRFDSVAQVNRATYNNITGILLQQPVISPISGPPVRENSATSVFGSAVGLLIDWEPFDFGLRRSRVDVAESSRKRAEAAVSRSEFEAGTSAADAYLTALAAQEIVRAAQTNVARTRVLVQSVEALVKAELRPGAHLAVARAEAAAAQAQVVRAEQAVAEAKALLAGFTGHQPGQISVAPGRMLELPPGEGGPDKVAQNPAVREQAAVIDEAKARARTLDHAWMPRFSLQGTTYARGSGARPDFTTLGGANGLAPSFYNWGLGFTVKFPILDYAAVRVQQAEEAAKIRVEENRSRLILTELEIKRNRALAAIEAARKLAGLTPVQLEAARAAESQAQARYKAGLAPVVEVADAQRVLAQAEIDNGIARLNVWRALLALRAVEGDLTPLLQMAGQ
ncbi:MAG: TolC family protein [Bryobacteraceae bacterium]